MMRIIMHTPGSYTKTPDNNLDGNPTPRATEHQTPSYTHDIYNTTISNVCVKLTIMLMKRSILIRICK